MSNHLQKHDNNLEKIPYKKILKNITNIKIAITKLNGSLGNSSCSESEELSDGDNKDKENENNKTDSEDNNSQRELFK